MLSGDITLTFRLWRTPKVKVGGPLPRRTGTDRGGGDRARPVRLDRRGGLAPRLARPTWTRCGAARLTPVPIDDDTLLYRIEFHVVE